MTYLNDDFLTVEQLKAKIFEAAASDSALTRQKIAEMMWNERLSLDDVDEVIIWMHDIGIRVPPYFDEEYILPDPGIIHVGEYETVQEYLDYICRIPAISAAGERALAELIREGDDKARDELINASLRLTVFISKQYRRRGIEMIDLIQEGNIALIKAADRYQGGLPMRFLDYACWHIHYIIGMEFQRRERPPRVTAQMSEMLEKTG
ncbi:MAG: hypothetical protein IJM79_04810, partial [Erysipelotrichaceae bacterium]|nr:hypothetical protein [Erysipelotrichaceae bacterium]